MIQEVQAYFVKLPGSKTVELNDLRNSQDQQECFNCVWNAKTLSSTIAKSMYGPIGLNLYPRYLEHEFLKKHCWENEKMVNHFVCVQWNQNVIWGSPRFYLPKFWEGISIPM